jgi:hypothetical protein
MATAFWGRNWYVAPVQAFQTVKLSGLAGQSPLPDKIRTELAATRWRLRSGVGDGCVSPVQAFPTAKLSGLAGQSPLPDKIRTELVATRWRLRSGVGDWYVSPVQAFQTAKLSGLAGQSPPPDKIRTELAATRWRLRSGVGNWYVAPVQAFQTVKLSGLAGQSPLPDKIRTQLAATRWRLRWVPAQPFPIRIAIMPSDQGKRAQLQGLRQSRQSGSNRRPADYKFVAYLFYSVPLCSSLCLLSRLVYCLSARFNEAGRNKSH